MARKQTDNVDPFRTLIARPRKRRVNKLNALLNGLIGVLALSSAGAGYLLVTGKPFSIEGWANESASAEVAASNYVEITPGVSTRGGIVTADDLASPRRRTSRHKASGGRSDPLAGPRSYVARFTLCHTGGGQNCVVDGDTAWIEGVKVRIADIDAPETHPSRCQSEADLGDRATIRMAELLNAGPFELEPINRDEDRYGRKLRIIARNGQSLGGVLVSEGLARWYGNGRRPWC